MNLPRQTPIPTLVRVKPGALDRLGIYCERAGFSSVTVLHSKDLFLLDRALAALTSRGIRITASHSISEASFEAAAALFEQLDPSTHALIGIGGGKALDVAKYVAFLSGHPALSVPTSLSNDGFCSPQSSLTRAGRRHSLPSAVPYGVVIDTEVCLGAPKVLWLSGVGDMVAKLTAVCDWKLAFHAAGTPVDDFAALLSDASVHQFLHCPTLDLEGLRVLGTALLLNGVAMSICGSSRPASGSEHLISHALDHISARPRLHGLQVGVASYLVSLVQGANTAQIHEVFERTGFWNAIAEDPFSRAEWIEAIRLAPGIKPGFYTILSEPGRRDMLVGFLQNDPVLQRCFVD